MGLALVKENIYGGMYIRK